MSVDTADRNIAIQSGTTPVSGMFHMANILIECTSFNGPGYITSLNVVRKIVKISVNISNFPIEDVYIAHCPDQIRPKIHHTRIKGFYAIDIYQNDHNPCLLRSDSVIAMNRINAEVLLHLWNAPCTENIPITT